MRRLISISLGAATVTIGLLAAAAWAGPACGGQGCCGGCAKGGGSASMADARDTFHALLSDHEKVRRTVEQIDGGVATTTVSDDPQVAEAIRKHVRQMKDRVERGEGLRHWDPLFVEVFKHHDEISMTIDNVPGGVRVRETSKNPDVVKLIRAHADAVSEFAARGFDRAHEASPLPDGYPSPGAVSAPQAP